MRFLIDRCAGRTIADWLRAAGHDVVETRERGPDPGDLTVLEWAYAENRILITIDTDFGQLVFLGRVPHHGLIRLPDVPAIQRINLLDELFDRFRAEIEGGAVVTISGGRIRITRAP